MYSLRTAIKLALGTAAVALPATGAWALTPTQVNALTADDIIYVSGSTATDSAIKAWAKLDPGVDASAPFQAGTYDLYTTATGYILTGTATSTFTGISGTNIAIVKQTQGGSAIGIVPVARGTAANGFPDLSTPSSLTATCGSPTATAASSPFQAFSTYACTLAESSTIVPNAGISDEDPTTWIGTGSPAVSQSDVTALTTQKAAVEVPFAIAVSKPLRDQLQSLEGLTSGSDTLANVPSLTSAQVRAMLSGQLSSLKNLYVFNPTTMKTGQVDTSNAGAGSFLHVCRRGDTSGSQFAANIRFFAKGCSKGNGVGKISPPDDLTTQANGQSWTGSTTNIDALVFAGSGTGDVLKCLASPISTDDGDAVNYRIGFASTDQAVTGASGFRYIAIDGNAPTIWNIQLYAYDWLTQDSFNYSATSMGLNGGPGNHQVMFDTIQKNLSNINGLAGLNQANRSNMAPGTATADADGGIVTVGNTVLYTGGSNLPQAPTWPAAIRDINVSGHGPNSPLSKTFPTQAENNCNAAYQASPTG